MLLRDLRLSLVALAKTGLLSPSPLLAIAQFLWCYVRSGGSLYTIAAWSALRFPNQLALVEPGKQVTFAELLSQANQLALMLNQIFAIKPGQTIGILCRNHIACVETLLACGRLGVDTVLLNTGFTSQQLLALLKAKKLDALICDGEFKSKIEGLTQALQSQNHAIPNIIYTDQMPKDSTLIELKHAQNSLPWFHRRAGQIILLTSGTTGPAKVVRRKLKLEEILGIVTGLLNGLQPQRGHATLLTIPLLHGHGLATLGLSLAMGAPLFMFSKATAEDFLRCIEQNQIRVLVLVPTILYRLLEQIQTRSRSYNTDSLRTIVCGSAPLDSQLATRALAHFGPVLYNLYGSSEAGIISMATPEDLKQEPATVGKVLPGVDMRILRSDQSTAAIGETGHIWMGGLNTGDMGYLDQGRLFLMGRADEMLICGGENIFPQTIEETVNQRLEYVLECAAIGIPDPEYGQAIHLFVVLKPEHREVTPQQIAGELKVIFPKTTRPKKITILEALPKNLAGKILRYQLAKQDDPSASPHQPSITD